MAVRSSDPDTSNLTREGGREGKRVREGEREGGIGYSLCASDT